jgi:hypothetical protein
MKALNKMNSVELLLSFDLGQGKTCELPSFTNIEHDNEVITINYNNLSATVTPAWLDSYVLMQLHRDIKDAPDARQEKLFAAFSENRLSLNHNISNDSKAMKKPIPGHYLTAEEYKANCFKANATAETLEQINTILDNLSMDAQKADLHKALSAINDLVITRSQADTLAILSAKEEALYSVKNNLEAIGAKVTIVNETTVSVSVAVANVNQAIELCIASDFQQVSADFDAATMSIVLTMEKANYTAIVI